MSFTLSGCVRAAVVAALLTASSQAFAQNYPGQNYSGRVFAQSDDSDPELRIERLEHQLRELTGQNEELQHRNQVLEQQLRQLQGNAPAAGAPAPQASAAPAYPPQPNPGYQPQQSNPPYAVQPNNPDYQSNEPQIAAPAPIVQEPPTASAEGGRRGDAFDPSRNPNAPGAPRPLGGGRMPMAEGPGGGPAPGQPIQLGNVAPQPAAGQPYPTNPDGLVTDPPSRNPRDEFDLGIGYMQHKDYALAEQTMRNFTQRYPNDRLVADAQYWLGESLFQRQRYRDAAESFLAVTTKFETSPKAPDALLRLGQSLAALKEKEAACATFGEVGRKYPKASGSVKQAVDREQKRNKC